jgi:hypothetical protein
LAILLPSPSAICSPPAVTDARFILLDEGAPTEVEATIDGPAVRLAPEAVAGSLGWELKPEGLCRDAVCVPVRDRAKLVFQGRIDLAALAAALDRPLALDVAERAAYLGASARARAAQLASLQAPDVELPDLAGRRHALSDYRGRKVLLVAYASW